MVVRVRLRAFELPADGMWCLRVNGVELSCVGDNILQDAVPVPLPQSVRGASGGGADGGTVVLQAVLRAGLEEAVVVRQSAETRVWLVE